MEDLLSSLDPAQREAVLINDGSLLVFAGAGSGKTRVITTKIAYALKQKLFTPDQILAVTFTNKACEEMKNRVASMTDGYTSDRVMIKTFHSFGLWMLRLFPSAAGLTPDFQTYDEDACKAMLRQCFPDEPGREMSEMADRIARLKDCMIEPDDETRKYYDAYEKRLRSTDHVDFADMILRSIEALENDGMLRSYCHDRFRMILVDEYQDSNRAQAKLLRLVAGPKAFVCVVGDDDQSIYRFRGADVGNILGFRNEFPGARTVTLGTNYRCTAPILSAASDVIVNNQARQPKQLSAAKKGGALPGIWNLPTDRDEADFVISDIREKGDYEHTAIIYRNNFQSKLFEDRLMKARIPYHIVANVSFYDRAEVQDSLALLSLCLNHKDSVNFSRMANKPSRGLGEKTLKVLEEHAEKCDMDMIAAAGDMLAVLKPESKTYEGLKAFRDVIEKHSDPARFDDNVDYLQSLLLDSGIIGMYAKMDENEGSHRSENISQLIGALSDERFFRGREGLRNFLDEIALTRSATKSKGSGVTLITMHSVKGLEFRHVYVTGMEQEIIPGSVKPDKVHAMTPGQEAEEEKKLMEEERRLCYVAFTRALETLTVTMADTRNTWGRMMRHSPSEFVNEIRPEHMRRCSRNRFAGMSRPSLFGRGFY